MLKSTEGVDKNIGFFFKSKVNDIMHIYDIYSDENVRYTFDMDSKLEKT